MQNQWTYRAHQSMLVRARGSGTAPSQKVGEHQLDQWGPESIAAGLKPPVPGEEAKTLTMPSLLHVLQMEAETIEQCRSCQGERVGRTRAFTVKNGNCRMTGNNQKHEMPGNFFNPYLIDTSKGLKYEFPDAWSEKNVLGSSPQRREQLLPCQSQQKSRF